MTDPLPSLDLRLTPDWLKESEPPNRYADYEGEELRDRGHRPRRDTRGDNRPRRGPHENRARRDAPGGPAGRPAGQRPAGQRPADPRPARPARDDRSRPRRDREESPAYPQVEPAPVQVDFLPEERAFSKIIQQIKVGHTAYPLFGLARMFLERPERHRVRIRSLDNQSMLYQFGEDGPVAMEPTTLERLAFNEKKDEFYQSEIVEKEPIKGNFTSIARCTLSGKLLGPTNYHTFQPTIRSLYEQRFSRRMSFEEYRRTVEITTDPEIVNQWKEEIRKVVTFRTKDSEDDAEAFDSIAAVEQHFRAHYLEKLMRPCLAAEISGETARHLSDRRIVASIRKARDRENRFPAQIAGALRFGLNQAGLHIFKHKKRILYISTVRPQLFDPNQATVSAGLASILSTLKSFPKITRKQLAEKIFSKGLGEKAADETSPEYQQAKTNLATDLIWLAKAGHVIEFADGTLDLPLPPKQAEKQGQPKGTASAIADSGEHEPGEHEPGEHEPGEHEPGEISAEEAPNDAVAEVHHVEEPDQESSVGEDRSFGSELTATVATGQEAPALPEEQLSAERA
jgi:hypothetical protein